MLNINNKSINIGASIIIDDKMVANLFATITKQNTTITPNISISVVDEAAYVDSEECKNDIIEFNELVCNLVKSDIFN